MISELIRLSSVGTAVRTKSAGSCFSAKYLNFCGNGGSNLDCLPHLNF